MVITVSHAGYIKRLPVSALSRQRRGRSGRDLAHTKKTMGDTCHRLDPRLRDFIHPARGSATG